MRREEFSVMDEQELEPFLQEMTFGYLSTMGEDGWPTITPLNFVYAKGSIYFHGSKIGEKMRNMKIRSKVSFAVAKEYAIIPSYFLDPHIACPATSYFKSVHFRGIAETVEDPAIKAEVLTAFMEKLQAEGGYSPLDPDDKAYAQIHTVAVVRIEVSDVSAKFKFGQNLSDSKRKAVEAGLEARGADLDAETIALMEKYCPAHKKSI
jgi:nitroimidazol reductase NimA-like FMN-containing flavoprotein (pyridoxamine 5'-phosphate oxidase superfamily)